MVTIRQKRLSSCREKEKEEGFALVYEERQRERVIIMEKQVQMTDKRCTILKVKCRFLRVLT